MRTCERPTIFWPDRGIPDELDLTETFVGKRIPFAGLFFVGQQRRQIFGRRLSIAFFRAGLVLRYRRVDECPHLLADHGWPITADGFSRSWAYLRKGIRG